MTRSSMTDHATLGGLLPLIHFTFPKGDKHFINPHAWQPMVEASGLTDVLAATPQRRRRAVDVAAHAGMLTQALSRAFNRVDAFEPQPTVHECLAANLSGQVAAGLVRLHRVGLAERIGQGFVNLKLQPNSQQGTFSTQSYPNALPAPAADLDSFGWEDVDLIRIGPAADALAVLTGARQTLETCRPVIWIQIAAQHEAADADALAQTLLDTLLEGQGYSAARFSAPEQDAVASGFAREGLILSGAAPAEQSCAETESVQAYLAPGSGPVSGKVILASRDGMPLRAGESAVRAGPYLWPAQTQRLPRRAGPLHMARTAVPPSFTLSKPLLLPGEGAETPQVTLPEAALPIGTLFEQQEITAVTGGLVLSLTPEAAALIDYVSVDLAQGGTDLGCIFQKAVQEFDTISHVRVDLPRNMIQDAPLKAVVRFHAGGVACYKRRVYLDVPRDHIAPHLVTCYNNRGGGGNDVIDALAGSLGAPRAFAEDGARPGVAVVWGVLRGSKQVIDEVAAANGIFYYIDHAYFERGHRKTYRITKNAFEAGPVREAPSDRLEALDIPLVPWRTGGREIIVCPPTEFFKEAHNCHDWLEQTLTRLKAHTDRPIIVREKPKPGETVVPLPEALETAHALVTHSSNVAIEAAVMGTPVFVSPSSAAAPVGLTDLARIESPVRPERWGWLAHLAYSQFSYQEIQSGAVWRLLRKHAGRPLNPVYAASDPGQEAAE